MIDAPKMRRAILAGLAIALATAMHGTSATAQSLSIEEGALDWLTGTRQIVGANGVVSYETFITTPDGLVAGAAISPRDGGNVELFHFGENEEGVYGLSLTSTSRGLKEWVFVPLKSVEEGQIVFGNESWTFSISATPNGGTHNVSRTIVDGEVTVQEWHWELVRPSGE